ncbi:hypothetical protein NPIL_450741 [Nephila pilipes]|uniref:Uncharacterized protein n=1 Tax=Nephila pilipes TaxID=299642 RepID=A0A8X6NEJ5_NEPPI|nr:hypothetical protein NPIL_450741 [Nephila pilipes]
MPRRLHLSEKEKGKILSFKDFGDSGAKIALKLGGSKDVVDRFLINPVSCVAKKRIERSKLILSWQERQIYSLSWHLLFSKANSEEDLSWFVPLFQLVVQMKLILSTYWLIVSCFSNSIRLLEISTRQGFVDVSGSTNFWMKADETKILQCLSKSLDLNPI